MGGKAQAEWNVEPWRGRERLDAYWLLRAGFTAAPILAGLDKFTERMVRWEEYLAPAISRRVPVSPRTFMKVVGAVEVAGGALVATVPKVGPYVIAGWLGGIIGNLLMHPNRYFDIALRDFGLMLGALSLARLEADRHRAFEYSRPVPGATREGATQEGAVPMPQRLQPTLEEAPSLH